MKPTVKNLQEYFRVGSPATIQRWKTTRPEIYKALVDYFEKVKNKEHALKEDDK